MFRNTLSSILVRGVLIALLVTAAPAYAGSPRVNVVYPSGGQRGTEVEIECRGSNLEDTRTLLFEEAGFETTVVTGEKVGPEKAKVRLKVKIPATARIGEHTFRLITNSGVADLKLFHVSPFPMLEEQAEDRANPAKLQTVPLGTTVYGRTPNEDQDRFEVEVKKGDRITALVVAARLQTQQIYDPAIAIAKADGTVLVEVDDTAFTRQDPVASVVAPDDGKYVVTIKESTNAGTGECHYLMHLGSYSQPLAAYPLGGPAGEEVTIRLIGDPAGPIEQKVKLPAQPNEKFPLYAEGTQPTPAPNLIRVSNSPNVLEAEPNNEVGKATNTDGLVPVALNGVLEEKGDIDFFKLTVKKGQVFDIDVFGRRLRSPIDSVLALYDAKGSRIQLNDDDGQPDSKLRWNAPADGDFFLSVKDQLDRGGPLFTYRVEIAPVQPKLAVWLPEMVINSSQERRAIVVPKGNRYASLVRIRRSDIAGDVELVPTNLPLGVSIDATAVDKSVDTIPMVFEAAPDAAPDQRSFELQAKVKDAPAEAPQVPSFVQHDVDVAENGNQRAFYGVRESRLPIAVTDELPVKINLIEPKVPILQNGSMNLRVVAERSGDFKGPINLALLYSPPGIGFAGSAQIKEGENECVMTISANGNAALQKWKICVVGSADFGKGPVWFSTPLVTLEVAAPFVTGKIQRTFVDQGDETTITVQLEQKAAFEGKARVTLAGLPPGVTCEEKEITSGDKELTLAVKSASSSPPGQHKQLFAQFKLVKDGEEMLSNFAQGGVLRVDKASVAKAEDKK
jgi:hypothetical protein